MQFLPNLTQDTELFMVMMSKIWYIGAPQELFPWGRNECSVKDK